MAYCYHGVFKLIELIFAFTILFLARFAYQSHTVLFGLSTDEMIFGFITYTIYLIYLPAFILAQLLGERHNPPWRTDAIFSLVGCFICLAMGTKTIQEHRVPFIPEHGETEGIRDYEKLLDVLESNIVPQDTPFNVDRESDGWYNLITSKLRFIQGGLTLGSLSIILGGIFFLDLLVMFCRLWSSPGPDLSMKFNLHPLKEKDIGRYPSLNYLNTKDLSVKDDYVRRKREARSASRLDAEMGDRYRRDALEYDRHGRETQDYSRGRSVSPGPDLVQYSHMKTILKRDDPDDSPSMGTRNRAYSWGSQKDSSSSIQYPYRGDRNYRNGPAPRASSGERPRTPSNRYDSRDSSPQHGQREPPSPRYGYRNDTPRYRQDRAVSRSPDRDGRMTPSGYDRRGSTPGRSSSRDSSHGYDNRADPTYDGQYYFGDRDDGRDHGRGARRRDSLSGRPGSTTPPLTSSLARKSKPRRSKLRFSHRNLASQEAESDHQDSSPVYGQRDGSHGRDHTRDPELGAASFRGSVGRRQRRVSDSSIRNPEY